MKGMNVAKWTGMAVFTLCAGYHVQSQPAETAELKAPGAASASSLYLVSDYDPQRDPARDLEQALALARKEGKNVMLQVGGDWCGWCSRMTKYFHDTRSVHDVLSKNYVLMKVNFSNENRNEAFLSAYPKVPAFPHLFVLDSSGKVLCSQYTGDLEEGSSYNEKAVLEFLNKWTPVSVANSKPDASKTSVGEGDGAGS